jgi:hypothetical protein
MTRTTDRINRHLVELGSALCRKYGLSPLTATVDEVDAAVRKRAEEADEVCRFLEETIEATPR